jgi:hypothetical protein
VPCSLNTMVDSVSLAAQLLGSLTTPSQAAIKAETRLLVQEALNSMDPIDREVLALKHFEQVSTAEIASVLGLSKAGAGSRCLRAIKRLREILTRIPGFQLSKSGHWTRPARRRPRPTCGSGGRLAHVHFAIAFGGRARAG